MKEFWLRRIALLCVVAMLLGVASCGQQTAQEDNPQTSGTPAAATGEAKDELVAILDTEPESLDPTHLDISSATVLAPAFESLAYVDADNNILPGAASKWEISDDGLVYTFHLREDAKWSDGEPVVADDFVFAWERVISPEIASDFSYIMTPFIKNAEKYLAGECSFDEVGLKAINDKTLEVTLESPTSYFLSLVATNYPYIPLRRDVVENDPSWSQSADKFICNGPFVITEINPGENIVYTKNENYWDSENIKLNKVTYNFVTDPTTALLAFQGDECDISTNVPLSEIPTLEVESDEFYSLPRVSARFLTINTTLEQFSDLRVRQALSLAIDRDYVVNDALRCGYTPSYSFVPAGIYVGDTEFREYNKEEDFTNISPDMEANIAEAQRLLAEAGYPNGEGFPPIEIKDYEPSTAEVIAKMWEDNLGITCTVSIVEWQTFLNDLINHNSQVAIKGWTADYLEPSTMLTMFTTFAGVDYTGWTDPEYDRLVREAMTTTDTQEALEKYSQAERLMLSQQPIIPLLCPTWPLLVDSSVEGWGYNPLGILLVRDAYFAS